MIRRSRANYSMFNANDYNFFWVPGETCNRFINPYVVILRVI